MFQCQMTKNYIHKVSAPINHNYAIACVGYESILTIEN